MSNRIYNVVALFDDKSTSIIEKMMTDLSVIAQNDRALRFPPHFTLRYDFEMDDDDFDKLAGEIQTVSKVLKLPAQFEVDKVTYTPWNAVWLEVKVPKEIEDLHTTVMNIVQKYRTGFIDEDLLKEKSFDEKQKKYINEYGYHLAFEYYAPHITVAGGKIEDKFIENVKRYPYPLPIHGNVDKIAFFRKDDDGNRTLGKILNV